MKVSTGNDGEIGARVNASIGARGSNEFRKERARPSEPPPGPPVLWPAWPGPFTMHEEHGTGPVRAVKPIAASRVVPEAKLAHEPSYHREQCFAQPSFNNG
jgi:hypothetical protein